MPLITIQPAAPKKTADTAVVMSAGMPNATVKPNAKRKIRGMAQIKVVATIAKLNIKLLQLMAKNFPYYPIGSY